MSFDSNAWPSGDDERDLRWLRKNQHPVSLEELIQEAGGLVQPSENLRPRTLESARHREGKRKLFGRDIPHVLLAMSFLLCLSGVICCSLRSENAFDPLGIPHSSTEVGEQIGTLSPWAVVDAVWEWRKDQVSRLNLGRPLPSSSMTIRKKPTANLDLIR